MTGALARRRPRKTLVLNADLTTPLSTWPPSLITAQEAVHALYRDRVTLVEVWDGEFFHSPSTTIAVPKVVAIRQYIQVFGAPKFCRLSIFLRDRYRCQYCGEQFPPNELTFDHVVPRADGGETTWENILTACVQCNGLKKDKPANYSGRKGFAAGDGRLRPLKLPRRPTSAELMRAGLEMLPSDIKEDFGSHLYWNVALEA